MHKLIGILIEGEAGAPLRRGRPCAALKKGLGHAICAWAYGQTIRHREARSPLSRERERDNPQINALEMTAIMRETPQPPPVTLPTGYYGLLLP